MKFCILGCQHGHIDSVIAGLKSRGWELEFIADRDPWLAARLCEKHNTPLEKDWRKALARSEADLAGIAPVNSEKGRVIEAALRAGKHVVADKPLVVTRADLARVERAAKASRKKVWALFTLRYSGACRALRRVVESGELGGVVSVAGFRPHRLSPESRPRWMFKDALYGGIIIDLLCHDIDLFLWLARSRAERVVAAERSFRFKGVADCGTVFLALANGATGLFRADWLTPREYPAHGDCRFFVTGTEGSAELRFAGDPLRAGEAELVVFSDSRAPERVPPEEGFPSFYDELTRFVDGGPEPELKSREVVEATRVTVLARESAKKKRPVAIPRGKKRG